MPGDEKTDFKPWELAEWIKARFEPWGARDWRDCGFCFPGAWALWWVRQISSLADLDLGDIVALHARIESALADAGLGGGTTFCSLVTSSTRSPSTPRPRFRKQRMAASLDVLGRKEGRKCTQTGAGRLDGSLEYLLPSPRLLLLTISRM